ncbi:MAG: type II toxin-antitoxin system VapC family toxin [Chloroflexi bacterium]|nr:type II toxin-antitoxin system VapC family toxin [Chloroflexota bacterium]
MAAKWIFEEPLSAQAEALYRQSIASGERIVAPPLLPIEVTNVIRQCMRRAKSPAPRLLSLSEAEEAVRRFVHLPIALIMPAQLHQQALQLAARFDLPAVYDAHYLALARLLGCALWTADRTLVNTVAGGPPFVRWLGEYTNP